MKAIVCHRYGSADVLKVKEVKEPVIKKHQVLIDVKATSVNPVDWKIRSGALMIKTGFRPPKILGSDFSGVILSVGSQVNDYQIGDEIWGKFDSFKGGAYAQKVVANIKNISKKPKNVDFFQAAAVPNVALTAYQAMVNKASLKQGQHVMINGASGGVGLMAIQIAKAMDCHVTAVCSAKNATLVKSLGADVILDYNKDNILSDKKAYDVFFDCVSNQSYFKVYSTLKNGATHIKTTPSLITALGSMCKPFNIRRPDHIMVKPNHQHLLQLKSWVENKQLVPFVQDVLPLYEANEAHRISQTGRVVGKLVLDMTTS